MEMFAYHPYLLTLEENGNWVGLPTSSPQHLQVIAISRPCLGFRGCRSTNHPRELPVVNRRKEPKNGPRMFGASVALFGKSLTGPCRNHHP